MLDLRSLTEICCTPPPTVDDQADDRPSYREPSPPGHERHQKIFLLYSEYLGTSQHYYSSRKKFYLVLERASIRWNQTS